MMGSAVQGARASARCHMLQQAGRKHVYVESGGARARLHALCTAGGDGQKNSTQSYVVNYYGVRIVTTQCRPTVNDFMWNDLVYCLQLHVTDY